MQRRPNTGLEPRQTDCYSWAMNVFAILHRFGIYFLVCAMHVGCPPPGAEPGLTVSIAAIVLDGLDGTATFDIRNTGDAGSTLTFNLTPDAPWIVLDRDSGSSSGAGDIETFTVSVDESMLSKTVFEGTIAISSNAGNAVISVILDAEDTNPVQLVFEQGIEGFEGFEDTSIFEEFPENAGGGIDGIFAGTIRTGFVRRALVRVDLGDIPPGSVVTDATLEMTVERSGENFGAFDLGLHPVLREWTEGDVTAPGSEGGVGSPANSGDPTWNSAAHNGTPWDNIGGDFAETPSATASAGQFLSIVEWGGEGLIADIQRWIDDPASNFGWMIVSSIEDQNQRVKKLVSSEGTTARPRLTVEITPG